jgi:hypothetical protein
LVGDQCDFLWGRVMQTKLKRAGPSLDQGVIDQQFQAGTDVDWFAKGL